MWIPLLLIFPASIYCMRLLFETVSERQQHMAAHPEQYPGWTYPDYHELTTTLISLLVLLTLRVTLCNFVFAPLGRWILPTVEEKKGKWTPAAREDRVQRFSVCVYKLCYFLAMTVYGFITLKDEVWLPPQLGGHGSVDIAWNGWPYSEVSNAVKQYYLIELSYHAHSLVFHLFTIHRNDFIEMTLHHTCAILLVFFSYFMNFVRLGSLVLFLHDIADVWAYAVKAVVDTKYTAATLCAYAGLLVTWGYTRLYVLPVYVISVSQIPGSGPGFVWMTSYFMIWVLQCLHIYWYILFLIMGYRFLVSGKTVDIQQKAGETDGSYVDYHKTHVAADSQDGQPQQQDVNTPQDQDATEDKPVRTRSAKKSRKAD
jgi:hypothetical protein